MCVGGLLLLLAVTLSRFHDDAGSLFVLHHTEAVAGIRHCRQPDNLDGHCWRRDFHTLAKVVGHRLDLAADFADDDRVALV